MLEIGRIVVKIAGRDSGKRAVIVDVKKDRILIDGETRRREVNPAHVEPLKETVKLTKGASHAEVKKALEPLGYTILGTKPKKAAKRPIKKPHSVKEKQKPKKKAVKKEAKKDEVAEAKELLKKQEKPASEKKPEVKKAAAPEQKPEEKKAPEKKENK